MEVGLVVGDQHMLFVTGAAAGAQGWRNQRGAGYLGCPWLAATGRECASNLAMAGFQPQFATRVLREGYDGNALAGAVLSTALAAVGGTEWTTLSIRH